MAIKTYEKCNIKESYKIKNLFREITILKTLEHPNILKLLFTIEDARQIHLITEHVQDNLKSCLRK
jgi:serine/threonine protein kinase